MSAEHSEQPCEAKPTGNSECFVGNCGNTMETKIMFKFPDKGERREAWCKALNVDPNLDVVGRSRLLKGAVVCEDHFVMDEDVENYMYSRLMGGKVKLKKSAIPRLETTPKHTVADPLAVTAVKKELSTMQDETKHNLAVSSNSSSMKINPYVKLIRLSAAEIVNSIYPTVTCYGSWSKPRPVGVDEPRPMQDKVRLIGSSTSSPKSSAWFENVLRDSSAPLDVKTEANTPLQGVTPLETPQLTGTPSKVTPPEVTPLNVTSSKITPFNAAAASVNLLNAAPLNATSPNIMPSNVKPSKTSQNISGGPKIGPLKVIQPTAFPHIKSEISDVVQTPQLSKSCEPKFTCHHCNHRFVALNALKAHMSEHLGVSYNSERKKDIIVKGETVRLRKNALPKKPIALKLKPKQNSGTVMDKKNNKAVVDDQKPKRINRRVIKPVPPGAQPTTVVTYIPESEPSAAGSAAVGFPPTPGSQLKLDCVRKLVKSGLPNGTVSSSPGQDKVMVPISELLKSGVAKIVSTSPEDTKLMLPLSQVHRPGYPTKRIVRVIKLPAGANINHLKAVNTVGSSNIGWTAAVNKKITSTATENAKVEMPTDEDVGEVKTNVHVNCDAGPTEKQITSSQNAARPSQRTVSPSKTKLVRAGKNLILVRTKPLPPPPKSNAEMVPAVENAPHEPEKCRPGPKCFKSKTERKPIRPALKVNKAITEVRLKVEPNKNPTSLSAKTTSKNPQNPQEVKLSLSSQKYLPKRGRPKLSKVEPIENGKIDLNQEIGALISGYMQAPTKTESTNTAVTAPNVRTEPKKYRPGPKCFKRRLEEKIVQPTASLPAPEPIIPNKTTEPGMNLNPAAMSAPPKTKNIPSKRRRTKLSGEKVDALASESIQSPTTQHMQSPNIKFEEGNAKGNPTPDSKLGVKVEPEKCRPGPKRFKRKLEGKTVQPNKKTSLPGPKLMMPSNSANLYMRTTPSVQSVLPATKSPDKRQRTKLTKGTVDARAPDCMRSPTPHQLIVITTSYPPNVKPSDRKHAEVNPITSESRLGVQMDPKQYRPGPKRFKRKPEEKPAQANKSPSLPGPKLISPTNTAAIGMRTDQAVEFPQPKAKSILGKRRRTKLSEKEVEAMAAESMQPVATPQQIPSPNIESSEKDSAEACHSPESESETTKPLFTPKFEKPTTRHSTGKLKKSRIFDDFETSDSPRSSPTKNIRSPNKSMLETKIGTPLFAVGNFLTPSPPVKRRKLALKPGPSSPAKGCHWAESERNSHLAPRILVLAKIGQNETLQLCQGEFACCHCGKKFQTRTQLKLHAIVGAPSCTLQGLSLDHSEREEPLPRNMPSTENAIKSCFDLVDQIGARTSASTVCEDPFEDNFPVVKQEDRKPAYIRDWSQHPIRPPSIRFSGLAPGFKPVEIGKSPLDYFLHFVTPEFLQETCTATNKSIEWVRSEMQPEEGPSVALLTVEELLSFLAVVLLHFAVIGGVAEWLGDYGVPVGTCLTSDRFRFLLQALSFSKEADVRSSPLLKYFNERMRQISNPPKQLLLSEAAVLQNDSLVYSRFLASSGYQGILYNLSSQDGTVHRICLKKDAVHPPGQNKFPNPVIDSLMDGLFDKGYSLYMSSFYCSVQLAEDLLKRKTYCTGTVRNSRIIAPPEIHRAVPEQLLVMKRSTHTTTSYYTKDGICFTKWDEGHEIMCISSEWDAAMVGDEEFVRPQLFHNYAQVTANRESEGVPPMPRLALMMGNSDVKLTFQILAMLFRNAYILFTNHQSVSSHPPITFKDFHFEVAKHLLAYPTPVTISPNLQSHLPTLIEGFRHNSVLIPRKMCDDCEERATAIFCTSCPGSPSLCPACYRTNHEQISILIFKNPQKTKT